MEKYWDEDIKSYPNCFNAGEINIDLSKLFSNKLCLSLSSDHINSLKDYGFMQMRTNSMTEVIVNMIPPSLKMLHVGLNWEKKDSLRLFIELTLLKYNWSMRTSWD